MLYLTLPFCHIEIAFESHFSKGPGSYQMFSALSLSLFQPAKSYHL
jgi:hypothetical protein